MNADYYQSGVLCYLKLQEANVAFYQSKLSDYLGVLVHRRGALRAGTTLAEADAVRLYETLAHHPTCAQRLAKKTGTDPAAVREWLGSQVTRGHLQYDAALQRYWMTEQQAFVIGREPGLCFVPDAFRVWRRSGPFAR
ncbi:MAG TPA: hypothetical protein VHV99_11030 [Paraburkholderia sp.]|nr:hypothetical protein [Paraburkholderia sp.]